MLARQRADLTELFFSLFASCRVLAAVGLLVVGLELGIELELLLLAALRGFDFEQFMLNGGLQ